MCSEGATLAPSSARCTATETTRASSASCSFPTETGPHAVVVVIHGGYWKARYDCSLMTGLCEDLARQGVAAWNLEYRRVGNGGGWPETFADVAAGVDLLSRSRRPARSRARRRDRAQRRRPPCALGGCPRDALGRRARRGAACRPARRRVTGGRRRPSARRRHATVGRADASAHGRHRRKTFRSAMRSPRRASGCRSESPSSCCTASTTRPSRCDISESYAAAAQAARRSVRAARAPAYRSLRAHRRLEDAWRICRDWVVEQLSSIAARSEETKRSSSEAPSSAACSAAEPTTIPSASSAAAAACAGVEMPNPA